MIDETNIYTYSTRTADSSSMAVRNFSGRVSSFTLTDTANPRHSDFDELEISVETFEHYSDNGFYKMSLESFNLSAANDHITFKEFYLNPLLSAYEMALEKGHQLDKYDIEMPEFIIEQTDLKRWLIDEEINAGKITLMPPDMVRLHMNVIKRSPYLIFGLMPSLPVWKTQ